MEFLIQNQKEDKLNMERNILEEEIIKQKYIHNYNPISYDDMMFSGIDKSMLEGYIPIGSIEFVQGYLSKVHNIEKMNPIEVPEVLRTIEFLKRDYSIVKGSDIPKDDTYFIKDVSTLKNFWTIGSYREISNVKYDGTPVILPDKLYQVSEFVEIESEYRVFVMDDEIIKIVNYAGDPLIFPDGKLINKMRNTYLFDSDRPMAYTMDIAVIKDRGTALLEIHPFVSIGLYTYLFGSDLPLCYAKGFQYYLNSNKKITECKITR